MSEEIKTKDKSVKVKFNENWVNADPSEKKVVQSGEVVSLSEDLFNHLKESGINVELAK